ncbi:MAG: hypothetical protein K8W52_23390, partial [Deltaproteobacteria bacterium]|nr:hypothetical protein [Deltaproteobacteria bacterium]
PLGPSAPSAPMQVPVSPAPGQQPSSSRTLLGVAAPIIPQSMPQGVPPGAPPLSPYPSPGAFPAMGSSPAANGYAQQPPPYGAAPDFSNLMAPQNAPYQNMPPSAMAAAGAPVFTPPGYQQALPLPAGVLSPPGMPAYRDDYQSGAITPLAVGATVDVTARRPRASMRKDIIIGVAIAAAVLAVVAVVKVVGSGGGATTGSLVVTLADSEPADVFVNGEKRGTVQGGTFKIEKISAGAYDVKVVRPGASDCVKSVKLDENGLAMVRCEFAPAAVVVLPPDAAEVAVAPPDAALAVVSDGGEAAMALDAPAEVAIADAGVAAAVVPPDAAAPMVAIAPIKPEPVKPPPITPAPTRPDPTKPDPTKVIKPAKPEPVKPEPTKPDPTKVIKPVKPDSSKPAKPDPSKPDPTKPDPSKPDPKTTTTPVAVTDEGYLVAYTTPFSRVVIDGVDTGKTTPIGPRGRIALKPGKHKIKFVVGDQSETISITIEAGKTAKVTRDLQIGSSE